MPRHVIAVEGKPSVVEGVWLDQGSLRMPVDRKLPVTMAFDSSEIIGLADDLERNEDTGEVSVNVELKEGVEVDLTLFDYSFAAKDIVRHKVEATDDTPEHHLVTDGVLTQIAVSPLSALRR